MRKCISTIAITLIMVCGGYAQSGVNGKWVTTDFGGGTNILELKNDGGKLTGTISREGLGNVEVVNIYEGTIQGNAVTFKAKAPAANQGRTVTYKGNLNGSQIAFTRSVVIEPGGVAGGAGIYGSGGPMTFSAKRDDRATITPSPFNGNWQLNIQKSSFNPGPAPILRAPDARQVATRDNGFTESLNVSINAQGAPGFLVIDFKDDGKSYPVYNAMTIGTYLRAGTASTNTVSSKLVNPRTREMTFKASNAVTAVRTIVISADGRTMTETVKGFDPQGKPTVTNTLVFDKQ